MLPNSFELEYFLGVPSFPASEVKISATKPSAKWRRRSNCPTVRLNVLLPGVRATTQRPLPANRTTNLA